MSRNENVYRSRKKMLADNFLGGIAWSLGVTLGGAVIISLIAFIVSKVNYVPILGDVVLQITNYVAQSQNPFNK